eukprot:355176-Chlamydomonas_euryale.AAC.1
MTRPDSPSSRAMSLPCRKSDRSPVSRPSCRLATLAIWFPPSCSTHRLGNTRAPAAASAPWSSTPWPAAAASASAASGSASAACGGASAAAASARCRSGERSSMRDSRKQHSSPRRLLFSLSTWAGTCGAAAAGGLGGWGRLSKYGMHPMRSDLARPCSGCRSTMPAAWLIANWQRKHVPARAPATFLPLPSSAVARRSFLTP